MSSIHHICSCLLCLGRSTALVAIFAVCLLCSSLWITAFGGCLQGCHGTSLLCLVFLCGSPLIFYSTSYQAYQLAMSLKEGFFFYLFSCMICVYKKFACIQSCTVPVCTTSLLFSPLTLGSGSMHGYHYECFCLRVLYLIYHCTHFNREVLEESFPFILLLYISAVL